MSEALRWTLTAGQWVANPDYDRLRKWYKSYGQYWWKRGRKDIARSMWGKIPHVPERIFEKIEKVFIERWLKTTLWYECGASHGAWHIDVLKSSELGAEDDKAKRTVEQEEECWDALARAFTGAMRRGRIMVHSFDELKIYLPYRYTRDVVEMEMGLGFTSVVEDDGSEEEILELWRCRQ